MLANPNVYAVMEAHSWMARVNRLEEELAQMPQVDLNTTHEFADGMYARTVFIPAGCTVTGATHKKAHINVITGDVTAHTEDGMKRLTGHHVITGKPGIKRAVFAHSDTTWTTICPTVLTDLAEIEADLVEEPERLQTRVLTLDRQQFSELEN